MKKQMIYLSVILITAFSLAQDATEKDTKKSEKDSTKTKKKAWYLSVSKIVTDFPDCSVCTYLRRETLSHHNAD